MKVLLAVDGSPESRYAASMLATFPFAQPPEVHLLSVSPVSDLAYLQPDVSESVNALIQQSHAATRQLLEEVRSECAAWAGKVTTEMRDGHVAWEIVKVADHIKPDVVVVGSRGLRLLSRIALGSVSDHVAKTARCSVLIVRKPEDGNPAINRIVIGHDGSPLADAAVKRISTLRLGAERSVHLHGIVETQYGYGVELGEVFEQTFRRTREQILAHMQQAVQTLQAATPNVSCDVVRRENAGLGLVDCALSRRADLVVVGSRGKTAWERMLLGSTSVRVLHHAPCSVWIER